jgi:hypothetical protein
MSSYERRYGMHRRIKGTCTECGKNNCIITILDEVDQLCDECLDSSYTQCDVCGEYYPDDLDWFCLKDGRLACEYCIEDFAEEDIAEEDIEDD